MISVSKIGGKGRSIKLLNLPDYTFYVYDKSNWNGALYYKVNPELMTRIDTQESFDLTPEGSEIRVVHVDVNITYTGKRSKSV